jgi:hypothetical protein
VPLGWRNPSCRIRLIFRRARKRQFCTPSLFGAGTPHPLKNIIANTARPGALSVCSSVVELVFETEAGPSRLGRSGTRGRVGAGADRPYQFAPVPIDSCSNPSRSRAGLRAWQPATLDQLAVPVFAR